MTATKAKKPAAKKGGRAATTPPAGTPEPAVLPLTVLDLTVAKAVRAGTDAEAVERYTARYAAGDPMPPLECTGTRGDPATPVWVGDGGHRALALGAAGKSSADCLVWWCDTPEEAEAKAWEIAYAGNTAHGLPRSSADLRAAVRAALLREPPASSDRSLADKLHCHRGVVVRVRHDMTEAGELEGKARFDQREYKDSEYAAWKLGKGKRPDATPPADHAAAETPAARPPEPTPTDWRNRPLSAAGLEPDLTDKLKGEGLGTLGELADALDGDKSDDLLRAFGEVVCERLAAAVDASRPPTAAVDASRPPTAATDEKWYEPAGTPATSRDADPAPAVVRDEKGRRVPDALLPVFASRTQFRSLSQRLGSILAEVESLAAAPGGAAVQVQAARKDGNDLSRGVAVAMPYVVCPACGGEGTQTGKGKACPECSGGPNDKQGRGWVSRLRYDQFPPELKKKCEAGDPDTQA